MSAKGRLYLTALTSLDRLEIQYVPPSLKGGRGAKVPDIAVVGRNNPLHHYTGGTTNLTLELDFHSELADRTDVIKKVRWLESLAYSDGFDAPPENIRLTFGKLFQHHTWLVKRVQYDLSLFDELNGYLPKQAYVRVQLELDTSNNLKTEDVKWN